ncbi:hypothetical protein KFU94_30525 [Chloroflexi bacterium TSY]|nr:hypothetical protein [Chloroflexi bacterium TSY]
MLILFVAFALRAYHLDFQSFWSDEGISLQRSSQDLGDMLDNMPVEHVPGYFVFLHFWLLLTGHQDFSVRFLSLWPSVLAVALIYRFTLELSSSSTHSRGIHTLWGRYTSCAAAALLAVNGFQIWYAQEARMYSWLLATSLASHLFLWRLLAHRKQAPVSTTIGYILSTATTVYLHFYGFLTPIVQILYVLVWFIIKRDWQTLCWWIGSGVATLILFLPWLPRALGILEFSGWRPAGDPWRIPWRYLVAYTGSSTLPSDWENWLPWLYLILILMGLIVWTRQRAMAALFLFFITILSIGLVLGLALRNPDFHERYSIMISAPLLILVAGGSGGLLWPRIQSTIRLLPPVLILMGLLIVNGYALNRLYYDESLHKPDFHGAAWRIQHYEKEGDVILVDGPDPQKVFLHYYRDIYHGAAPVHDLRSLQGQSGEEIAQMLAAATENATRAWELLYFHGPGPVQHWLATHGWTTAPSDHNDIRIILYGLPGVHLDANELGIAFGPDLILERSKINGTTFEAGDLLYVTTEWQVRNVLPDYKFSLRLQDQSGNLIMARDYVPLNWFAPTSTWGADMDGIDRRGLILPENLSTGQYRITLRLYDPSNGVPVETKVGQDVVLADIQIVEP